jgi:hypothetical protein
MVEVCHHTWLWPCWFHPPEPKVEQTEYGDTGDGDRCERRPPDAAPATRPNGDCPGFATSRMLEPLSTYVFADSDTLVGTKLA